MKRPSEKQDSNGRCRCDKRSRLQPIEWTINFAPPPLPGQMRFEFDAEPIEKEGKDLTLAVIPRCIHEDNGDNQ